MSRVVEHDADGNPVVRDVASRCAWCGSDRMDEEACPNARNLCLDCCGDCDVPATCPVCGAVPEFRDFDGSCLSHRAPCTVCGRACMADEACPNARGLCTSCCTDHGSRS